MAHSRFFSWHLDNQRYANGFLHQAYLHPEPMFAQQIPMVGCEYHNSLIFQTSLTKRIQYFAYLVIQKRGGGVVSCHSFLFLFLAHFPVLTIHIIDSGLW